MPREFTQHELQDAVRLVSYDWRARPDWDEIEKLQDEGHVWAMAVPDSHGDDYVVFFSEAKFNRSVVQQIWDNWDWMYEEEQGRA